MKKLFVVILMFVSVVVSAQYVNSVGIRGGLRGIGLTYKQYIAPQFFLNFDGVTTMSEQLQGGELVATFNVRNKIHNASVQSKGLTWSYGGGIHGGFYRDPDNTTNESHMVLGPDVRLGAEYVIEEQWCIGLDLTGFYNVMPLEKTAEMDNKYSQFFGAGVFIRYVIQ